MTTRQNLHTHCTYCDGKNTIREMVASARESGLTSLGFSSHPYTGLPDDFCGMEKDAFSSYCNEIREVSEEMDFEIFTGLELESRDANGDVSNKPSGLDYAIGSCHYYQKGDVRFPVDYTADRYRDAVDYFGGEKPLMESYYEQIVSFAKRSDYDITGHFDLVTKFLDQIDMSFTQSSWYLDLSMDAMDEILREDKIIEINTGAISRGYRKTFYPSLDLVRHILQRKGRIIISSDSHRVGTLTSYFEQAEQILKDIGFRTQMILTKEGFKEILL